MRLSQTIVAAALGFALTACGTQNPGSESHTKGSVSEDNVTKALVTDSFKNGKSLEPAQLNNFTGETLTCNVRTALRGEFSQWEADAEITVDGSYVYADFDESRLPFTTVQRQWSVNQNTGELSGTYEWDRRDHWTPFWSWTVTDVVRQEKNSGALVVVSLVDEDQLSNWASNYWNDRSEEEAAQLKAEKLSFGHDAYKGKYVINVARCFPEPGSSWNPFD